MTTSELLTGVLLMLTAINVGLTVASYRRAGAWKESEEAKALNSRVVACEGEVSGLKARTEGLDALNNRISAAERVLDGHAARMENVATKADVTRLTAEVNGIEKHIKSVEGGVERIESFLMNNAQRGHA